MSQGGGSGLLCKCVAQGHRAAPDLVPESDQLRESHWVRTNASPLLEKNKQLYMYTHKICLVLLGRVHPLHEYRQGHVC